MLVTPEDKPVGYVNITDDVCRSEMIAAAGVTSAVEDIRGHPALSFSTFAADHANTWR
ncbi:hypothetical protein GN330_02120 [Nitratireductor sp. CAU 1489]|uniref:Uncharacterized protein n=1 Tax=Nitratireductor arenosus TaxID=2682096 RepID=A0A844QBM2_9HYPH|nr:hypothetical protein [Nitratireductor arenosus]MVA96054.1 hypothetical protein [Nitratireductor arenosus]